MGLREEARFQCAGHSRRRRLQKRRRENKARIGVVAGRAEEKVAGKRAKASEKHMEEANKGHTSQEVHSGDLRLTNVCTNNDRGLDVIL